MPVLEAATGLIFRLASLKPVAWPAPLKTAIQLMLDSTQPANLLWGEQLFFFYNDAYTAVLGEKHPQALASPFWEIWPEVKEAGFL